MIASFAVEIVPVESVILGRRLNLCALLGNRLVEQLRNDGIEEEEAIRRGNAEIPLVESYGVYAGSSAMITRCRTSIYTQFGSLERHLVEMPQVEQMLKQNERKRSTSRDFDNIRTSFPNARSRYVENHLDDGEAIWFVGHGDRSVAERLLYGLKHIGARRREVQSVTFHTAMPTAVPGLLGHDGTILRPVPCASGLKPRHFIVAEERFRPPYWKGEQQQCFVPPVAMWDNAAQIKRMIGV